MYHRSRLSDSQRNSGPSQSYWNPDDAIWHHHPMRTLFICRHQINHPIYACMHTYNLTHSLLILYVSLTFDLKWRVSSGRRSPTPKKMIYMYTYFKLYFCYFLISSKYIFDFSVYARLSCVFTNALEYSLIFGLWLNSILLGWLHSYKTMTKVWCELCYCITKYQSIHDRFSNQSILFFGLSRSI